MKIVLKKRVWRWLLLGLLCLPFAQATPATAQTFMISCGDNRIAELIEAINSANTTPEADTIELSAGCVYVFESINNVTGNSSGNALPVISTALTIHGNGAIFRRSATEGTPDFRFLYVNSSGNLTLTGLTLANGKAQSGGAIAVGSGLLTVQQSTFTGNTAGSGGAIFSDIGIVTIQQSTFTGNTAGSGGAVFLLSYLSSISSTSLIEQSTISGNTAGTGGGVVNITNNLIIRHSTITGNVATNPNNVDGGGIYLSGEWGFLRLHSTIVAGNSAATNQDIALSDSIGLDSRGFNLIGSSSSTLYQFYPGTPNANNDWVGTPEAPLEPQLGPLADNGGPTWTHLPLTGSLALDHGPRSAAFVTDQRGLPRVQGAAVDIGSVEQTAPPVLTISDSVGLEGTTLRLKVELYPTHPQTVTVEYATSDGTALAGSDYVSTTGVLTFTPGMTETTILVSTTDDLLDEVDETFTVTLSGPTNASLADSVATVTIIDHDNPPFFLITDSEVQEGVNASFKVLLSAPSAKTISLDYATSDETAEAGLDYVPVSGTLTFTPGMTETIILVSTTDDLFDEDRETFVMNLSNTVNILFGDPTAVGSILDNDEPLQFSMPDVVGVEGTSLIFTATLDTPSTQTVTVDYYPINGTAVQGVDYLATSGSLTFTPGMTQTTILVSATDNLLNEPSSYFMLVLGNEANATVEPITAYGTIVDNDLPPTLSISDATQSEGDSLAFTVTLDTPSGFLITMEYTTNDGTALSGTDYISTTGVLTFTPGMTKATILVSTTDDLLDESDETFTVNLYNLGFVTIGRVAAIGTIRDDDTTFTTYLPFMTRAANSTRLPRQR